MTTTQKVPGLHYPDETGFTQIASRLMAATKTINDRTLSLALGLQQTTVNAGRQRRQIPMAWIVDVVINYKASASWLIFGKEADICGEDFYLLPILEPQQALDSDSASDQKSGSQPFRRAWLESKGKLEQLCLLRVPGNSMEPLIRDRDLILINTAQNQPSAEANIFVIAFNDSFLIKRIYMEPGKIIMNSENSRLYPDISLPLNDIESIKILGKAVWWGHEEA